MSKCVIVVDDKHPNTDEGFTVGALITCLEELASQLDKDIAFHFVFVQDAFTEPIVVYLIVLHALAASRAGYEFGGIALDCFKQEPDPLNEGDEGGLLLLEAIENIVNFPCNATHFDKAKRVVQQEWASFEKEIDLSDVMLPDVPDIAKDYLDDKPFCFYTTTFVDVKKLEKKHKRKIVWIRAFKPMDRAKEIFKELNL